MALTPGVRLGPYEVGAQIGVGGMGEVYQATDTNLKRQVAIKILPEGFAADPDRLARFQREAEVLAALNHPNIAQIHGLERSDGTTALIMELVAGPTLADRIARGALPVEEALPIAKQIAEVLESAHEQGIIHRDLKPANIKVRPDGTVKVLDFGLAKVAEPVVAASSTLSLSPTITTPAMTQLGLILGTAAYMSPEQAKGRSADKRSDIWAFGCVLYEMLTGRRAFDGEDTSDTLAAILRTEPDWTVLPRQTPAALHRLLRRTIAKDVRKRIADAASLRLDIDDALNREEIAAQPRSDAASGGAVPWTVAGAAVVALAVGAIWLARKPLPTDPPELHVEIATPETRELTSMAISPDGQKIVYTSDAGGQTQLLVRDLSTGVERALPSTTGAVLPFWAPHSRSIGFFASGRLKTIDIVGGPPRDLAAAPGGRAGGTWGPDGTIVFAPSSQGLFTVDQKSGSVRQLELAGENLVGPRAPTFLPDGRHFVFQVLTGPQSRGLYVTDLAGSRPKWLASSDASAVVVRDHILFVRGGTLLGQRLDLASLEVVGDPFVVADPITTEGYVAALSASNTGTLAFRGRGPDRRQLKWFGRSGRPLEPLGEPDAGTRMSGVVMSPDGQRVATARDVNDGRNIWIFELGRSVWTKLTAAEPSSQPLFSPNGQQIAFISSRRGSPDIYLRSAL